MKYNYEKLIRRVKSLGLKVSELFIYFILGRVFYIKFHVNINK